MSRKGKGMSNRINFLGIQIPDIPSGLIASDFRGFPNYMSEEAKILLFIKEMQRASRDDIYDKFPSAKVLGFFKSYDLVRWNMDDDTYSLTEAGEDMVTLVNWFAPVYDLIEFMEKTDFSDTDELDILLAMAGRHDLVEKDALGRVRMVYCYGENTLGQEPYYWVRLFLRTVFGSLLTYKEELETLFKKIDTEVAA